MLDTFIIGAGIAGLTSALYASRKRMHFEIVSSSFGGQMMQSGEVLNYPGIKETTGAEFAKMLEEQMKFNNVNVRQETVQSIEKNDGFFRIKTDKDEYASRTVIIASGARPRKLNVAGEEKYRNNGVNYCSICDGPLFSGADVAVIGGGDAGLESADFLINIAKKIYILNIGDRLTAHEYLQERITKNENVEVINNAKTLEILGDGKKATGIRYEQNGEQKELDAEGIFVEIGRVPNTSFAEGILNIDNHGHIEIDCSTHTNVPGIFAAGDCASGHEYQYVIAAGQGCMALIKAARYLSGGDER